MTAPSCYHSKVCCFSLAGRCRKSWGFKELKCCFQCCLMLFPTPGPGILFLPNWGPPFGIRELFRFYVQSHWHLCCPCDWTLGISKADLFQDNDGIFWLNTGPWADNWSETIIGFCFSFWLDSFALLFLLFCFALFCFKTVHLYRGQAFNTLSIPGWPTTHKNPLNSCFRVCSTISTSF